MSDRDTTAIAEALGAAAGHLRAGRFGEAEALATRVVETRPEQPDARHIPGRRARAKRPSPRSFAQQPASTPIRIQSESWAASAISSAWPSGILISSWYS